MVYRELCRTVYRFYPETMITKKDYFIGAVVGLCTGLLTAFIFWHLKIDFPYKMPVLIIGIPILWAMGVWLGKFLSRRIPFFAQFGKFATVGFLSSAIDFSILNIVSAATGVTAGVIVGWINVPGFIVATVNGYLWNKLWVFKIPNVASAKLRVFANFPKFLAVTIVGLLINSGIIILLTLPGFTAIEWFTMNPIERLNVAKIIATAAALIWNFIGYKFIAFRKL